MKSPIHATALALVLTLGIVSLASPVRAATLGYLYVTDYGKSELDRYQYTYDPTTNVITSIQADGIGNNSSNAYFLGGGSNPVKEGIHGTANDLIIVSGAHGSSNPTTISRYTLDGSLIGQIPINFSAYGSNVGIGNVLVTPDGKYMYAPLEAAGKLVKVDLSTATIVCDYSMSGVHDVAIAANGDVYASNYNNGSADVVRLDSNLNYIQVLVSHSQVSRPSGLSVAGDGSLFVNDNKQNGPDSIDHFTFTPGTGGLLVSALDAAGTYTGSATNDALKFTFGSNIGPDGKVYVAALGGGGNGSFGVSSGYVDGIYALNPSNNTVVQAIAGYTEKSGPASASGLSAPKYLQFDTNFAPANDAGYSVPEPSAAITLVAVAGFGLLRRRRC